MTPFHPRAAAIDGGARGLRLRQWAALLMIALAPVLIWYDFATSRGSLVLPSFLGVSMVVAGLRILFMNMAVREAERTRRARLERHE